MEEKIVDVFKEGEGREKLIYLEVDGRRIGTIHLGSKETPGNPNRIIFNINPVLFGWNYKLVKKEVGGATALFALERTTDKAKGSGITGSGG